MPTRDAVQITWPYQQMIIFLKHIIYHSFIVTCHVAIVFYSTHPFNVMSIVASRSTQEYVHSQYPLQRLDRALSRRNFTNTSPNLPPIHLHRTSSALAILTIVWNLDARCITHLTNLLIYHHIRHSLSINSHIFIVFGTSWETGVLGLAEGIVVWEGVFETSKDVKGRERWCCWWWWVDGDEGSDARGW